MRVSMVGAVLAAGVTAAVLLGVAGCDRGASAPARDHDAAHAPSGAIASSPGYAGRRDDAPSASNDRRDAAPTGDYASRDGGGTAAKEDTPLFHGEPMWAENRRHSARENAEYQCDHHGREIGATSLDDCLAKAHAFIKTPPSTAETAVRGNGDKLIFDPRSGLFAVARRDGAPRTFRKPDDGAAFWAKQKEELQSGGRYRSRAGEGDDRGGGG